MKSYRNRGECQPVLYVPRDLCVIVIVNRMYVYLSVEYTHSSHINVFSYGIRAYEKNGEKVKSEDEVKISPKNPSVSIKTKLF